MKKANNSFDEIMEWVLSAETIALAGHTNPDGDAIGACLALGGALEKAGKQVQVILEKYADKYQLIPNGHLVCAAEDARLPELFLALDCGDEGRLGEAAEIFRRVMIYQIYKIRLCEISLRSMPGGWLLQADLDMKLV